MVLFINISNLHSNNMPVNKNLNKLYTCFVCENTFQLNEIEFHTKVNLPICMSCKGTKQETVKVKELFDELADGFVCGCI